MKAYAQSTPGVALRVVRLRPRDLRADLPAGSWACPGAAWPSRWRSGWACPRRSWRDARARLDEQGGAGRGAAQDSSRQSRRRCDATQARLAAEQRELDDERARQRDRRAAMAARRRSEVEAFRKELRGAARSSRARRRTPSTRPSSKVEETRHRPQGGDRRRKARSEAVGGDPRGAGARRWQPGWLGRDAEPPKPRRPTRRSRSAARVRVRVAGRDRRGDGAARATRPELAVGGKRLRVPRAELLAVVGRGRGRKAVRRRPRAGATRPAVPRRDQPRRPHGGRGAAARGQAARRRGARRAHASCASSTASAPGRLRKAVAEFLDGHPHVAVFHARRAKAAAASPSWS